MASLINSDENDKVLESIGSELSVLPLRNTVAYPYAVIPLVVGVGRSIKLIEKALEGNRVIGLVSSIDPLIEEPQPGQVYEVGTVAKIFDVARMANNNLQVVVKGLKRFRVTHWLGADPYLRASVEFIHDETEPGLELDALLHSLRTLAKEIVALSPNIPDEVGNFLDQIEDPRYLAYSIAANATLGVEKGQQILEKDHIKDKLHALISHLSHEKEVKTLGKKIQTEAHEKMDKAQREYYLRQQLKAIKKELGETDEGSSDDDDYVEKLEEADLPDEAMKEAQRELKRLKQMTPQSAEYSVIKTYLDWLVELPWRVSREDQLDIHNARDVLDEDHYDLKEVKDRIIEFLAVRKLVKERGIHADPGEEATAGKAPGAAGADMDALICADALLVESLPV